MLTKKLVIIIWNMGLGGIQKRMRDVSLDISKNYPEWEIHFLIKQKTDSHFVKKIEKLPGVNFHYFSDDFSTLRNAAFVLWTAHQYLKIKPSVALTFLDHLSVCLVLIKKIFFWTKTKIVLNEGVLTSKYLPLNQRATYWKNLISWFYPSADLIIVPTINVKNDLVKNFKIPQQIISIVPNWTLLSSKVSRPVYDLIYIGRFEEEKNPLGFVHICHQLNKQKVGFSAIMLGGGSQVEKTLQTMTRFNLHQQINLLGPVSNPEKYLAQSKILVLPTKNEGLPNVVLEAGMSQTPTISSNFAGAKSVIIDQQTGYICQNLTMMSKKTRLLLSNNHLRKKMGRAAQNHVLAHFHRPNQVKFITLLLKPS